MFIAMLADGGIVVKVNRELEEKILKMAGIQPALVDRISEKDFMQAVIDVAKRNGFIVYHTRDSRRSVAGFPDLVALRTTRLVVAELKVGDRQPEADQLTWLEAWRLIPGAEVFVWRPSQWAEILAVLK